MRSSMRNPSSKDSGHRKVARAGHPERGQQATSEGPEVAASMIDALDHILQWERASERSLKAAAEAQSVHDVTSTTR